MLLAARNAQTLLEVGFTSARSAGPRALIDVALRDMINQGVILGPRILACGRILTTTGGLADAYGDWVENRTGLGTVIDGPQECLKAARRQIKYGVNTLKVDSSGAAINRFSDSGWQTHDRGGDRDNRQGGAPQRRAGRLSRPGHRGD